MWLALKEFIEFLRIEKGLSQNSIEAYEHDLKRYTVYFEEIQKIKDPKQIQPEQIRDFLSFLANDCFLGPRSRARALSAIRTFHLFILNENLASTDPTQLIDSPKLQQKLPEVLSLEMIDKIFDVIDLSSTHGIRNRAMLELLYSSGLRVSEMVSLEILSAQQNDNTTTFELRFTLKECKPVTKIWYDSICPGIIYTWGEKFIPSMYPLASAYLGILSLILFSLTSFCSKNCAGYCHRVDDKKIQKPVTTEIPLQERSYVSQNGNQTRDGYSRLEVV